MTARARILAMVAATCAALPAAAFTAQNGNFVRETAPGQIEVQWRGGFSGTPDFWCSAGDFVIRGLGLPHGTRIWRVSGGPRRGGEPMQFALSPEGAVAPGLVILWGNKESLSASGSRAFCER